MVPRDKHIRAIEELLTKECRGLSSARTIELLAEQGLLNHTAVRAFVARRKVNKKVATKMAKMEAMAEVAEEMGCSFATIRNYIYNK